MASPCIAMSLSAPASERKQTTSRCPLLVASQNGHLEVVCLLSDAGADKDIATQGDATPLFVASQKRHPEVVHLLFDAGADKDIAMQGDATPLLVASQQLHEAVRLASNAEWTPRGGLSSL